MAPNLKIQVKMHAIGCPAFERSQFDEFKGIASF